MMNLLSQAMLLLIQVVLSPDVGFQLAQFVGSAFAAEIGQELFNTLRSCL